MVILFLFHSLFLVRVIGAHLGPRAKALSGSARHQPLDILGPLDTQNVCLESLEDSKKMIS